MELRTCRAQILIQPSESARPMRCKKCVLRRLASGKLVVSVRQKMMVRKRYILLNCRTHLFQQGNSTPMDQRPPWQALTRPLRPRHLTIISIFRSSQTPNVLASARPVEGDSIPTSRAVTIARHKRKRGITRILPVLTLCRSTKRTGTIVGAQTWAQQSTLTRTTSS